MTDETTTTLINRLRHFSDAYPLDVWPPITEEERARVGGNIVSRISADMGRHCAKIMLEAAKALEDMEAEENGNYQLIRKLGGLLTRSVNILRGEPPALTLWSTHDVPELCAALVKTNTQLTTYAQLMQNTLAMLANCAGMIIEQQKMEVERATRNKDEFAAAATQAGTEAGDVPGGCVPGGTSQDAAG